MSEISSIVFDNSIVEGEPVTKGQPLGSFNYGGSSFAVIYENLPGMGLSFENAAGIPYPENPPPATSSSGAGQYVTKIGSKVGQWVPSVE